MDVLKKYRMFIVVAVLLVLALALLWPRRKSVLSALTSPLSAVNRLIGGDDDLAALRAEPNDTPQPDGSPLIIVPGAPKLTTAADVDQLRLERWPDFEMNDGSDGAREYLIWTTRIQDGQAATLLKRGVSHLDASQAFGKGVSVEKKSRFVILYRNAFDPVPYTLANIEALKKKMDDAVAGLFGNGVDILSIDLENDQHTDDYGQMIRALAIHAKQRWNIRLVDFVGMSLVGDDWNVTNAPTTSFFAQYLADVTDFDDQGVIYFTQEMIQRGDWAYTVPHLVERYRRAYPNKPVIGYFWHFNQQKTQYLPDWVGEGCVLLQFMAGGAGIKNWEDGGPGYYYRVDEAVIDGYYRLSRAKGFRRGVVEYLVPEISTDGGKTFTLLDAKTAKDARLPMVRVTKNRAGYQVLGIASTLPAGTQDVLVKVPGREAFPLRLYAEKNVYGVIPA